VVEENLRVGRRDFNNGSVRVRACTVEQPVRENVNLRDENVTIDRRAVDRPLTDADRAFQGRTISAEEHHKEAIGFEGRPCRRRDWYP
jgi:stress response protein YsnF